MEAVIGIDVGVAAHALALQPLVSWTHGGSRSTPVGLGLAAASALFMPHSGPEEADHRRRANRQRRDGGQRACSMVCTYMAGTVLSGLGLTAPVGGWWLNPMAGLAELYFVVNEGIEAIHEGRRDGRFPIAKEVHE